MASRLPFVTRLVRERRTYQLLPSRTNRLAAAPQQTWVFVWEDVDRLFGYVHDLVQDARSGFSLRDAQTVMADARRQLEARRFQSRRAQQAS
jgi:hypothetical protein